MDYFAECENMLNNFNMLIKSRDILTKRKERLESSGAPKDIQSFDFTKPYVSGGSVNDTYKHLFEYGETCRNLNETIAKIEEIENVVSQLPQESALVIRICFFDGVTNEEAAEALNCWSITTVYNKRNKAIRDFALLYYGAAALKEG